MSGNQWMDCNSSLSALAHSIWASITNVPCPISQLPDVVQWMDPVTSSFSMTLAWNSVCEVEQVIGWSRHLMFSMNVPRHSFIVWKCLLDSLATADQLRKRGKRVSNACVS
ncbi:hypothetical protein NE237_015057 [Protea cynaroides]|uniref:Reverse transcriptase zinc-binding domain-containing protein n=1 Tax=Protea cynaroides TaxID=273540 RepID=A0A9Q0KDI5_9MAGN|nr:hypothetical protein NE237_015057 [Protea cynaroides]